MRYPVVIHKDPQSDYGVTVPDLPGCLSAGETLDEALQEVVEAIETHLEGLLMDGEPIPTPQSLEHHQGTRLRARSLGPCLNRLGQTFREDEARERYIT
jgi:predicted RNase H-like HicB family nuclease